MKLVFALLMLFGSPGFAGGIYCKECPAENNGCAPKLDCQFDWDILNDIANGICPLHSLPACRGQEIGNSCGTAEREASCELNRPTDANYCECRAAQ